MRQLLMLLGLLGLLVACSGMLNTGPDLAVVSERFSEAMRWQDYLGAANHLQPAQREDFLTQFRQDEDLHVVDSQVVSIDLEAEGQSATVEYRLEYYRLPSMRVRNWQWRQEWQLQQQKALKSAVWQIVNPPPTVP